ncbi:MAG TPA: sugar phosphate isomerase/epimerase [Acidimicrobiales bacterium]|nr:sugar phosphate isomerase/epimerase [Acidimicrobiales bacterium]
MTLWWGTIEGADLIELIDVAAATGFDGVAVMPAMYFAARESGVSDAELRSRLADGGVVVRVIDPLIRALPGSPTPAEAAPRFRPTFQYGEDDCYRVAQALAVPVLNVAHYMCAPTPVEQLAEAIGAISERAEAHGVAITLEFLPEGSIPDIATAASIIDSVGSRNCGLMLDTWHLFRTSGTAADVRALPSGVVRAVQLSDADEDLWGTGAFPPTRDRLLPGSGVIPLVDILRAALTNCPDAVIGAEIFSRVLAREAPLERARRTRAALDALFAEAARGGLEPLVDAPARQTAGDDKGSHSTR